MIPIKNMNFKRKLPIPKDIKEQYPREDAVLEYASRLAKLQEEVADRLILVPRVYTNKPRTTGDGYKGLLHQPNPEKDSDMLEGVIAIRRLHTSVLAQTGLSTADEMLYPDNYRYLSDLLSYIAIGARSVENQEHRLTSSGIDVPVGMKNPTSGDISVMLGDMSTNMANLFPTITTKI